MRVTRTKQQLGDGVVEKTLVIRYAGLRFEYGGDILIRFET